jgi:hypothetical protein
MVCQWRFSLVIPRSTTYDSRLEQTVMRFVLVLFFYCREYIILYHIIACRAQENRPKTRLGAIVPVVTWTHLVHIKSNPFRFLSIDIFEAAAEAYDRIQSLTLTLRSALHPSIWPGWISARRTSMPVVYSLGGGCREGRPVHERECVRACAAPPRRLGRIETARLLLLQPNDDFSNTREPKRRGPGGGGEGFDVGARRRGGGGEELGSGIKWAGKVVFALKA